jgi:hypothetical protein
LPLSNGPTPSPGEDGRDFGVVHYRARSEGPDTDSEISHELNQGDPETVFRVRVHGLKPETTYRQFGEPGAGTENCAPVESH